MWSLLYQNDLILPDEYSLLVTWCIKDTLEVA